MKQLELFDEQPAEPDHVRDATDMVSGYAPGWPECIMSPEVAESYNRLIVATMLLCHEDRRLVPAPDIAIPNGFVQVERTDVRLGDFVTADSSALGYGHLPWPFAGYVVSINSRDQLAELTDEVPALGKGHRIRLCEDVVAVYRDVSATRT